MGRPFPNAKAIGVLEKNKIINIHTNCWEFAGCKDWYGYGMMRLKIEGKWTTWRAHRASAVVYKDYDPDSGLIVMHDCDNPKCFNPDHLTIGTRAENNTDRDKKGRHIALQGSLHGMSKLKEDEVVEFKRLLQEGKHAKTVAKLFAVSYYTVWDIKAGRSWKHVA